MAIAMQAVVLRFRCAALVGARDSTRHLIKRGLASRARPTAAAAASPSLPKSAAVRLKSLRVMSLENEGSSEPVAPEQNFPRPSSVVYDRTLANNIHLIGSVGVDPDIKYLDDGKIVATSSMSVKKTPESDPTWFFLEFQSDLAEIAAEHVRKGDRIHVSGPIVVENVPDKDNVDQLLVKVNVMELHFVDDLFGAQLKPQAGGRTSSVIRSPETAITDKRASSDRLWKDFFAAPQEWYDNRVNKRNPRAPDFKHRQTGEGLWLDGFYVPSFVKPEIAALEAKGILKPIDDTPQFDETPLTPATPAPEIDDYNDGSFNLY